MSKKSNWLLKNTAIFAIGNIMTKAVQFFLMPLYTALLTTSEYGISELFNNTVELIMPIVTLSITEAVFRFSMDRDAKRTHLFSAGIAFTLFGIIITALFCLIANGFLGKYYPIWLFLPLLASHSIRLLFAQYVRALEKVKEYAASGVLNSISLVIFASIFLSLLDMGIEGYILSIIASNTVSLLFLLFFVNIREIVIDFKIDCQLMGEMIRYSAPLVPNTISWWLTNTSSRYIVIAICGASIGGLFSAASKIPALMNVFVNTFQQAWVMSAIKEYEGNRDIGFQSRVFKMYSQFLYLISAIIIVALPLICKFLLRGDFYQAWKLVPLLMISATIGGLASFFGAFYSAAKKNVMSMVSTLVGGITNVVLCILLTKLMGVNGALIASIASYLVITIIRIKTTYEYAPITFNVFFHFVNWSMLIIESILITKVSGIYLLFPVIIALITCFYNREILVLLLGSIKNKIISR